MAEVQREIEEDGGGRLVKKEERRKEKEHAEEEGVQEGEWERGGEGEKSDGRGTRERGVDRALNPALSLEYYVVVRRACPD